MAQDKKVRGCLIERKERYYTLISYYVDGYRLQDTKSTGLSVKQHKKREAEAILEQRIQEKQKELEELATEKTLHSFADCFERWIAYKSAQIEATTASTYVNRSKTVIDYFREKDIQIESLTPKDLLAFYEWALKYGRRNIYNENTPTSLNRSTVVDFSKLIGRFLKDAVLQGILTSNPADSVTVPRVRENNVKEKAFMDMEQARAFLEYLKSEPLFEKLYCITKIGICYGLRRSEMLGLKWSAIDFEKSEISINHTIVRTNEGDLQRDNVKSKSSHRFLPLLDSVKSDLLELMESQKKLGIYSKNGYVFTWDDGRPYRTDYITKLFKKAVLRCDAVPKDLTLHGLRHSCTAILAEQEGWDLGKIHFWLGHHNISTTADIYSHVTKKWRNQHGQLANEIFK